MSRHLSRTENRVDLRTFFESYEAFKTYYFQLNSRREQLLREFMHILEVQAVTINQLEDTFSKGKKSPWETLCTLLPTHSLLINRVSELCCSETRESKYFSEAAQLCDMLRKFEVFDSTPY